MSNSISRHSSYFFLPKLKDSEGSREGIDIKASAVGEWNQQSSLAFQNVASSLDVPATGRDIKSISSIPDMWARPLSMEMALHNRQYPIRSQMVEQWQGMLAAIALAELRGFNLKAKLLELEPLKDTDPFARALSELLPSAVNGLYSLNGRNPWNDIYLFLWNGQPVGMTTPSTLICPSEEGDWTGLPWWSGGRLRSPVTPVDHLNIDEKGQLWQWLEAVRQDIFQHRVTPEPTNMIAALLREFQDSLGVNPSQSLNRSTNSQFFDSAIDRGALKALNYPIRAVPKPSSIRLIPSSGKAPERDLLLIPERHRIVRAWGQPEQSLWMHGSTNLSAFRIEDLPRWNVNYLLEQDVFLPELFFVEQADALPGGLLPRGTDSLFEIYQGKTITPLIPINPRLLDYLTPKDLIAGMEIQRLNTNTGPQIRLLVDLPLSGLNNGNPPMNYRVAKDYPLKQANALPEVPVLEVWPNFRSANWKEYYAFYYDPSLDTFQVHLPDARENYTFKGVGTFHYPTRSLPDTDSNCQLIQLTEFPAFIECRSNTKNSLGLILLKPPREVGMTSGTPWKVGVDFGTSFTNAYVERNGVVEQLKLESLHHKVTESSVEIRQTALYEYFIANSMESPLSTVLTTRGGRGEALPILDGRIYIPKDSSTFKPNTDDWIRTNLKWSPDNINSNRLFLQHLGLQITAQAALNNVRQIQWSLSYPSAFSRNDRNSYARNWQNLTQHLQEITGLTHLCPDVDNTDYYRTESLAVAQYFADFELPGRKAQLDLINSTCIDIGGGTSDISIWEENKLVHQCSIQLAGKDLFSQFIQMNPGFLERQFRIQIDEWRRLQGFQFYAKLDVLMRRDSEGWLRNRRDQIVEDPEFQGLVQLIALGVAGLYYYTGILLKVLHQEGKYTTPEITPVYLAGNGSRLLNWLAEGGQFDRHCEANDLFSTMLSLASGFADIGTNTSLSPLPKDEVACGLVLNESRLAGLRRREDEDPLIAGESCEINGQAINWDSRLQLEGRIEDFAVPQLIQLPRFLNSFHFALRQKGIAGIKPFEGYELSQDLAANEQLWRETSRELRRYLLTLRGSANDVRPRSPFVLGLRALLQVLGNRWADEWRRQS